MKLHGQLLPLAEITPEYRAAMFQLMTRHYVDVSEAAFHKDLFEKQWVILISDPNTGAVRGFSTQMLLCLNVEDRPVTALFSGDTIIDPACWGDAALSHVWGNMTLDLIDRHPAGDLYWFLISKGYKTYRFLPLFFHEFYPRYDAPTPPWAERLIRGFAQLKYPDAFDVNAGLIRAFPGKERLREGVADLTPQRLRDPHIRFFAQRNPRHAQGEELCCLAPLSRSNFTPAAYRVINARDAAPGALP